MTTRADVIDCARSYLGTPFGHMQRNPGPRGALDCIGLIVCTMRDLALCMPDWDVEPYGPVPDGVRMLAEADRYLLRIEREEMQAGNVVCVQADEHPTHLGIVGVHPVFGVLSIIHAANNAHPPRVVETRLMFHERCRFVAAFSIPGVV